MRTLLIATLLLLSGCAAVTPYLWPIAEDVGEVIEKDVEKDVEGTL
jgi:hypothetical protein